VRIFQFDGQQWNLLFVFYTSRGVKNEAASALDGRRLIDLDAGSQSEILYAAPAADEELPFAYVCPDVILRRPGKSDVTAQVKYKASKEGDEKWTYHAPSCKEKQQTHQCLCPPPWFHIDQLFWEAKVSKVAANYLIASSKCDGKGKTEFLPIKQTHYLPWWRERRASVVKFYDQCLKWYWEGDRSAEATHMIRRIVADHNEETQMAAVDAQMTPDLEERKMLLAKSKRPVIDIEELLKMRPESDADMEKCRKWTRMRQRVSAAAVKARPVVTILGAMIGSGSELLIEEFGLLWMTVKQQRQEPMEVAVGGKRKALSS